MRDRAHRKHPSWCFFNVDELREPAHPESSSVTTQWFSKSVGQQRVVAWSKGPNPFGRCVGALVLRSKC